jgi:hypothetical protein
MPSGAAKDAHHAAVLTWAATFSKTADGEETSEEALAILIEAQANGYQLGQPTGAIATNCSGIKTRRSPVVLDREWQRRAPPLG